MIGRGRLDGAERDGLDNRSLPVVEMRVLRALKTLRAVPDPDHRFLRQFYGRAICWPSVVHNFFEAYSVNTEDVKVTKFRPSPRDVSDMLTALSWLNHLTKQHFRLVWWRSFDLSFRQMADNLHRSDETARARYKEAIRLVWLAAQQAETAPQGKAEAERALFGIRGGAGERASR